MILLSKNLLRSCGKREKFVSSLAKKCIEEVIIMEGIEDNELTCLDRRKSRCWGHYCSGGRIRSLDSQTTKKERGRGGDGEIAVVCLPLSLPPSQTWKPFSVQPPTRRHATGCLSHSQVGDRRSQTKRTLLGFRLRVYTPSCAI